MVEVGEEKKEGRAGGRWIARRMDTWVRRWVDE